MKDEIFSEFSPPHPICQRFLLGDATTPHQQLGNPSSGNNFKCNLSLHWNNFSRFCHLGASASPRLINVALPKKRTSKVDFISAVV